jgi:hypothetical protein
MARTDMSAKAVTARLLRTAQLRRLCLDLRRKETPVAKAPVGREDRERRPGGGASG